MRTAPIVMSPVLLFWPKTSDVDVGGMAAEVELSHEHPILFCCCVRDGSRGEVWQNGIWHGSVDEAKGRNWIPPWGKSGTHWYPLMLAERFRDQPVDVSTVRWWVVCFSSGGSNMKGKLCSGWPCTAVTQWNEAHHHELVDYDERTVYRAEHQLQCIGNDSGTVGMSESLRQVGPTSDHTGAERILYANFSGPIEPIWGWRWQFPESHHYWRQDIVSPLQVESKWQFLE